MVAEELGEDLCSFVDAGPSPFHVVAEVVRRLEGAGYSGLDERERWALAPGDRRYVVRDAGTVAAFRIGTAEPSAAGFRIVGGHTDSPTFKVRPRPGVARAGYRLVGVEPYGGALYHTWFDRDLTLAGRVALRGDGGEPEHRLVHLPGAPLRIPSLAIHLDRGVREDGLKPDPQRHLVPLWGPGDGAEPGLLDVLADHVGAGAGEIIGHDLVVADTQPAARGGADNGYVFAPRLDNLGSCHAAVHALLRSPPAAPTQVIVLNDHEEVGSGSAEGARGPFLADVLRRIVAATEADPPADAQSHAMAAARSWMVSADMAHAVHPNYAERHEPEHRPRLGGGPVLKLNANLSYATDAATGGWFSARCAEAGVALQHFVTRADLPCGSTIGPLTATRVGIPTVDVGNPLLSMHSCREQTDVADVAPMIAALSAHLDRA
ncbi:MAG: M18 family aminopeptidase [Euzebyaceae bacterium]|nr:M18 family aminopeptidase [Euzebyaceae bacterium]